MQKLYFSLKDYEPEIEYAARLKQIGRAIAGSESTSNHSNKDGLSSSRDVSNKRAFPNFLAQKDEKETLALTRVLTGHEAALQLDSPRGLLLHGEVGTGKSMLVDILAESLPNKKKRRWHFNTFMLETFSHLERIRRNQSHSTTSEYANGEEYSILRLARDMISTSPILFLDEFQLPDRAATRILSNLLTPFFQLGGVLIATSNRMPDELANASGIELAPPSTWQSGIDRLWGSRWRSRASFRTSGKSEAMFAGKSDSAAFLEVLKARCDVWEMEGKKDWRRHELQSSYKARQTDDTSQEQVEKSSDLAATSPKVGLSDNHEDELDESGVAGDPVQLKDHDDILPECYYLSSPSELHSVPVSSAGKTWELAVYKAINPTGAVTGGAPVIPWTSTILEVYGRSVVISSVHGHVCYWTFAELCASNLGSADYITIASNFHTLILVDVPVLTFLQRNEARRFITLLDALYEARCKLLIRAEAGPDDIFFPETKASPGNSSVSSTQLNPGEVSNVTDSVYPETFSEIHQDLTSPFRPNIARYNQDDTSEPSSGNLAFRSILTDEDSDFGPPNRPSSHSSIGTSISNSGGPDFTRTGNFTGEDEKFSYRRAESRLWEMCSSRWWNRHEEGWWRPLPSSARHWERPAAGPATDVNGGQEDVEGMFRHGASPFRVSQEPPPKFSWVHAWGMMKWGKKAGAWGQGVEGLKGKKN